MAKLHRQHYADLADDVYEDRVPSKKEINIGGRDYKVLAVHNNSKTGYQGAVYQDVKTNEIIAAHRGTKGWIDIETDIQMVVKLVNKQMADADKLTYMAQDKARVC